MAAKRWISRPRHWMGVLAAALLASACGDDPTSVSSVNWQLEFTANTTGGIATIGTACRMITVFSHASSTIEPGWSASLDMDAWRTAGDVTISAEGADAVRLDFRLEPLASDFQNDLVNIIVSGAYNDTIQGRPTSTGDYRGAWECDETFLFAEDPALLATGYRPLTPIPGLWTLKPLPAF